MLCRSYILALMFNCMLSNVALITYRQVRLPIHDCGLFSLGSEGIKDGLLDFSSARSTRKTIVPRAGKRSNRVAAASSLLDFPPRLEFKVTCRNLAVLAAIAFTAIGTVLAGILSGSAKTRSPRCDSPRYLLFYSLCFLIGFLIFPAWIWLTECYSCEGPRAITLAAIHARSRGGLGAKWVSYGFTDPQGGHHGGSVMDFGGPVGDHF